jgi:hypothetical protein
MGFELSKVVEDLGAEALAKAGEPVGLDKEQSVRLAKALAAHAGLGNKDMIAAAAADTGIDEEVVAAMAKRLIEVGGEKLMQETPIGAAVDTMKENAMAAMTNAGGGFLKGLFGRK